ncbi:Conserved_hypothetical protein [Hexamita inflata]|uniref:Uncharacterized protein n=1 Tax=Hexamita inflata TaxID=28002 RepID=A0AA86R4X7_9EUKA|nr:Conserved hypothetical protein [Hexamita inflata]
MKKCICTSVESQQFINKTDMALDDKQLMNVVKVHPSYDIYVAIENNKLWIINQKKQVLGYFDVQFDFFVGFTTQTKEGPIKIYTPILYHPTLCNGQIYFQCKSQIVVLQDSQLRVIAQIPNLSSDESAFHSHLFSIKNRLFVHSAGALYEVKGSSLKLIKGLEGQLYFFQYCGRVFVFNYFKERIYEVNADLSVSKICDVQGARELVFAQSGIALISCETSKIYMFDLLTLKLVVLKNETISTQLGQIGLELNPNVIQKYLGADFAQNALKKYNNLLTEQYITYPHFKQQMLRFVNLDIIQQYIRIRISESNQSIFDLSLKIKDKMRKCTEHVENVMKELLKHSETM